MHHLARDSRSVLTLDLCLASPPAAEHLPPSLWILHSFLRRTVLPRYCPLLLHSSRTTKSLSVQRPFLLNLSNQLSLLFFAGFFETRSRPPLCDPLRFIPSFAEIPFLAEYLSSSSPFLLTCFFNCLKWLPQRLIQILVAAAKLPFFFPSLEKSCAPPLRFLDSFP